MTASTSRLEGAEHDYRFDGFRVRGFCAADRLQVLGLHQAAASSSVPCQCSEKMMHLGETYLQRPHDRFWVADSQGQIIGTVGIRAQEDGVGHLHCLRSIDGGRGDAVRKGLVQVAATHAYRHGCLKLVVHARVDVGRASEFLHRLGFEFSRQREVAQRPVLEFYLNLYQRPELVEPHNAAGGAWAH